MPRMFRIAACTLRRVVSIAVLIVLYLSTVPCARAGSSSQSTTSSVSGAGSTTPPDWAGVYATAGAKGQHGGTVGTAPAGFTTINPYRGLDEVVTSHLQPWALAKQQATDFDADDTGALCEPDGFLRHFPNAEIELLPSPGKITLVSTGIGLSTSGVRRIYLNRLHSKKLSLTWNGDSIGHWQQNTLIVDSICFNDKSWLMSDREPHSEALKVVERMRLVADGAYLEIQTTVEDPKALVTDYTFTRYYKKLEVGVQTDESVCNEDIEVWKHRLEDANTKKLNSKPRSNK